MKRLKKKKGKACEANQTNNIRNLDLTYVLMLMTFRCEVQAMVGGWHEVDFEVWESLHED